MLKGYYGDYFISLITHFKKNNYSGWLVVEAEQDPKKANPLEYAIKGFKYLKNVLEKTNIQIDQK